MRLYQQLRASIARTAVAAAGVLLFASGMPVSASGQAPQTPQPATKASTTRQALPPPPPSPVENGTPVSMEEAVRLALENNLGLKGERLNPEIASYGVARATAAYAPQLISLFSRSNSAAPPTDFLSAGPARGTHGNPFRQGR